MLRMSGSYVCHESHKSFVRGGLSFSVRTKVVHSRYKNESAFSAFAPSAPGEPPTGPPWLDPRPARHATDLAYHFCITQRRARRPRARQPLCLMKRLEFATAPEVLLPCSSDRSSAEAAVKKVHYKFNFQCTFSTATSAYASVKRSRTRTAGRFSSSGRRPQRWLCV